jgi:hypothetical protein
MDLKDILAISGMSGLYRFVSQGRNGVIIEGLVDKKRMNASATARVSALEDIAIFTDDKELPLKEVLRRIYQKENAGPSMDPKSSDDKLRKYFGEIVPDFDRDKVYTSDIKKVLTWYNLLLSQNIIDLEEDAKEETETSEAEKEDKQ